MLKTCVLLGLGLLTVSCKQPPQNRPFVPVIGLDERGKSEVKYVPTETFHSQMSPFIGRMSEEVSSTLENHQFSENMPWTLSRVTVGLALETEIDLFEIVEGELEGEIELRFQKNN